MPVPLLPLTIQAPGYKGLNTENSDLTLDPGWATQLNNVVFDTSGRACSREGNVVVSTNDPFAANPPRVIHIHESIDSSGNTLSTPIIAGLDSSTYKIFQGTSGSLTAITGSITGSTESNFQFTDFTKDASGTLTEHIIGFQKGHAPIVAASTAGVPQAFADLAGTAIPASGNCVHSAFGRLWCTDDARQKLFYSSLLLHTHWTTTGGNLVMSTYWPNGNDHIIAITNWENKLVVFGEQSIIIFQNMDSVFTGGNSLWDIIDGIGCVARDSVQSIGSDVLFLSDSGVRSLRKTVVEGKAPLSDFSDSVRTELLLSVTNGDMDYVKSLYSPDKGFYLLIFGDVGKIFHFDVSNIEQARSLPEAEMVRISTWDSTDIYCGSAARSNVIYLGVHPDSDNIGQLAKYGGYVDGTSTYLMDYTSPWLDLSSEQEGGTWLKIIKKINLLMQGGDTYTATLGLSYDFSPVYKQYNKDVAVLGTLVYEYTAESTTVGPEYWPEGSSEASAAEYGTSKPVPSRVKFNVSGDGQFFRMSITVPITGYQLCFQQIDVLLKRGRIAR